MRVKEFLINFMNETHTQLCLVIQKHVAKNAFLLRQLMQFLYRSQRNLIFYAFLIDLLRFE